MKIKVKNIWIDPADVSDRLAAKILETEINTYSDGDFCEIFKVENDFPGVQIGETEVEINLELRGYLMGETKGTEITERYLADSWFFQCCIDGEEVPFNDEEIFKTINNIIKI